MSEFNSVNENSQCAVEIPVGTRAVLVSRNDDGSYRQQPVKDGMSVLDIQQDLISHLSECPWPDAWLAELHSYVGARLEARRVAAQRGGVAVPRGTTWTVEVRLAA